MDNSASDSDLPLLQCPREIEEDKVEEVPAEHEQYYQVKLNKITNALLVPADMLSAKLNTTSAPQAPSSSSAAVVVAPNNNNNNNNKSSNSNNEEFARDRVSASGALTADPNSKSGGGHSVRYNPYHNTLRAAVLPSPDNTFYVEDTFVIGSYTQRRSPLTADLPPPDVGPRTPNELDFFSGIGDEAGKTNGRPAARSSPLRVVQNAPASRHGELTCSPSGRPGVSFQVRKPSKIAYGVHNTETEGAVDDPLLTDGLPVKKKKKKKHVKFPENVIRSVSVIEAEDQLRLLVEYNRPWYAYLVLFLASAFFVVGWSFIVRGVVPSNDDTRVAAVSVFSFVSFGFASVYLIVVLAFMWRPAREERRVLRDFTLVRPVLYVLISGILAQISIVCAFMITSSGVCLICFCCCPLVLTYTYEEFKKHSVSILDAAGCFFVVASFVVFAAGSGFGDTQEIYRRIVPVVIAVIGGAAMAFFLFQVRTVSRHVSNLFIMTSTLTLLTVLLAFITFITGGFTAPIGKSQKPLLYISSADFLNMILGALFIFLSWFTYHWSSLFFDRMTLSGSFSLGAPIALLAFYLMGVPTATLPFDIAGGSLLIVGCGLVLISGYRFRKNVEVQIDLERE